MANSRIKLYYFANWFVTVLAVITLVSFLRMVIKEIYYYNVIMSLVLVGLLSANVMVFLRLRKENSARAQLEEYEDGPM